MPSAVAHLEGGDEGGLRDFDLAELAHPLFALLLLFEELAFAGHVAAIAFGQHVLAQGLDGLARDDAAADRRLDRYREELAPPPHWRFDPTDQRRLSPLPGHPLEDAIIPRVSPRRRGFKQRGRI